MLYMPPLLGLLLGLRLAPLGRGRRSPRQFTPCSREDRFCHGWGEACRPWRVGRSQRERAASTIHPAARSHPPRAGWNPSAAISSAAAARGFWATARMSQYTHLASPVASQTVALVSPIDAA